MSKLVSVIIPTYKRPEALTRSVDSVLAQTHKNIEVVVVDDNGIGTEYGLKTAEVMSRYANDGRVKYVQHEKNINGSAARNTGIRASKGEYIMFLDDDDEFLPVKAESQLERLEGLDETWGACYSDYVRVSPDGSKLVSRCKETAEGDMLFHELSRNFFIAAGSNLMVRRSVIDDLGGFNESFVRNQDISFLVKILKKYKIARADKVGLRVHVHPRNTHKETFEQITARFIESFKDDINALPPEKQKDFYRMINLQRFRSFFGKSSTRGEAIKLIKNKDVKIFDAIRYFFHLAYRKIFKVSCGFKL
ncbi:MAG: glycosyltransferase family 2 protein [Clostridia bacterium]|nr:glycosyltransferase family 2 protein [Clostridia bacterium]